VRLLRIEKGKAFVDLLNETTNDSGENEMGYVERTLGFSTRYLEDRDIRLVKFSNCTCLIVFILSFKSHTIGLRKPTYCTCWNWYFC
jgi:hypothetical protein